MLNKLELVINNICKYLALVSGLAAFFMMMVA
jgi:hypothetical protein